MPSSGASNASLCGLVKRSRKAWSSPAGHEIEQGNVGPLGTGGRAAGIKNRLVQGGLWTVLNQQKISPVLAAGAGCFRRVKMVTVSASPVGTSSTLNLYQRRQIGSNGI